MRTIALLALLMLGACAGAQEEARVDPVTGLFGVSTASCSFRHLPGTIRRAQAKAAAGELPLDPVESLVLQRAADGNCVPYDPDYYPSRNPADLVCASPCARYEGN